MKVHSFLRVVVVATAVPLISSCDVEVPQANAQPGRSGQVLTRPTLQYAMMAGDSIGPICVHLDMPYSARICPDSMGTFAFLPSQVTAETLMVYRANRPVMKIGLPPRTDAIFLTRSAMSTFLLRHYDATDSAKAAELRRFMGSGRYRAP